MPLTEECCQEIVRLFTNVHNAIRCETEEEAIVLGKVLANAGITWHSGTSLADHTAWDYCKSETAYSIDPSDGSIEYCYAEYYEREGFEVINFNSIAELSDVSLLEILTA